MRILRILHINRLVLCLGLLGMFAFAGGCGGSAPMTEPGPGSITKETQKASRAKAIAESRQQSKTR